ncbi:cytochrome P450 [Hoeflea halophila]|uniref:Cytochrome P450 n=2 Tax=Hoeflea halophila TaxID=714899 RepID=A0A286IDM7_9HYPH|nr:cytochrome P450 [Hoeflea halophila]
MEPLQFTSEIRGLAALRIFFGFYNNPILTSSNILDKHGNAVSIAIPFFGKKTPPDAIIFYGAENNRKVYAKWDDLRMTALWPISAKPNTAQQKIRHNYMCLSGKPHRDIAVQIEAPLNRTQITKLSVEMHAVIKPVIDKVFTQDTFDLVKFHKDLSIQCALNLLFGERNAERALHIGHLVDRLNLSNYLISNRILKYNIPGLPFHRLLRQAEDVRDTLMGWIKEAAGQPANTNLRTSVLNMADADGQVFSFDFKIGCLGTLVWAAIDTPSLGALWTTILLSRNPETAAKLHDELKAAGFSKKTSTEELNNLPYLNGVVLESLRLSPPATFIPLKSVRETSIGSIKVPANTAIYLCPRETQRDPTVYPDPEMFRPERWDAKTAPDAYEFIAFSGGVRRCPGATFATIYIKMVIAMLVERGGLELLTRESIAVRSVPTMEPLKPVFARPSASGQFC